MTDLDALAERLRATPSRVTECVNGASDDALRARPAPREWSAIEVVGHLVDKLEIWRRRVERTAAEDRPTLDPYDQDELVRRANYQDGVVADLVASLRDASDRFARVVETLSPDALRRPCRHAEYGEITLRDCVTLPLDSFDDHLEQIARAIRSS